MGSIGRISLYVGLCRNTLVYIICAERHPRFFLAVFSLLRVEIIFTFSPYMNEIKTFDSVIDPSYVLREGVGELIAPTGRNTPTEADFLIFGMYPSIWWDTKPYRRNKLSNLHQS